MNSIALIGFMGSGKTTTAKALSEFYDMEYISTDSRIEENSSKKIIDIFEEKGEKYFRELEYKLIKQITKKNNCIFDLGGGVIIQEKNRIILKNRNIKTIFLNVPFNVICKRLENEREFRPLLNGENWKKTANELFLNRYNIYKQAEICIDIEENNSLEEIKNNIVKLIGKNEKN